MKVLHVIASMSPDAGGPVTSVQGLTRALVHEDIYCEIFTVRRDGSGADAMPPSHIPVHQFESGFLARFWNSYSRKLSNVLRSRLASGAFDLVHVHEPWHYPGFVAFRAAREYTVPYILTPHGALDAWCLQHKAIKKRIYTRLIQDHILKFADALHALTQEERARVMELGYETPVRVVPNGIDPAPFEETINVSDFLARHPGLSGKRVILFLGRLHLIKGLDVLTRSYINISRMLKDAALLIVGPDGGGIQKQMEATLKTASAFDRTVFTGMLTGRDKLVALASADLLVLPSHAEAFPHVVLEGWAARLPVVVSRRCGLAADVSKHDAGFVVEPNDDLALTQAISALLLDGKLRVRMGGNGRKLVKEKYPWRAVAASMADLYRTLADSPPRQSWR